jgi:hypothetical protein
MAGFATIIYAMMLRVLEVRSWQRLTGATSILNRLIAGVLAFPGRIKGIYQQ